MMWFLQSCKYIKGTKAKILLLAISLASLHIKKAYVNLLKIGYVISHELSVFKFIVTTRDFLKAMLFTTSILLRYCWSISEQLKRGDVNLLRYWSTLCQHSPLRRGSECWQEIPPLQRASSSQRIVHGCPHKLKETQKLILWSHYFKTCIR